jgi:hypothetical protein
LIAATVERSGETEIVDVTLRAAEAKSIKRRELYFSIVVFDCRNAITSCQSNNTSLGSSLSHALIFLSKGSLSLFVDRC